MEKEPLAYRMRPKTLEDIVGQEHILDKDKVLYKLINKNSLFSIILYGPPGTGKTSIAEVIANHTKYNFKKLNAVTAGVSDIKNIIEETRNIFMNPSGKSILFVDEIHRFNKSQQDVLLPFVESGEIILIGATTENPYFEINKALISRSHVFKLNQISEENIIKVLKKAVLDKENGYGNYDLEIEEEVYEIIARMVSGDIRSSLNYLETVIKLSNIDKNGKIKVAKDDLLELLGEKKQYFDKSSNEHYDTISALIKSIRGSDENATVHYLARLIASGEDPKFIARRLVISASEDIGLANPNALNIAVSGMNAIEKIGMPEGRIIMAEVAIYLAKSKKSNNAYNAINMALNDVNTIDCGEIPMHLRNAPISQMRDLGYNVGYKYPHDYKDSVVEQEYLPEKIRNKKYYNNKWGNDIYE